MVLLFKSPLDRLEHDPVRRLERAAPLLGQHNEKIYCERLGYSREELMELKDSGVI